MKKVFSLAFIAILSLTAILYSCQKPEEYTTTNNTPKDNLSPLLRITPGNQNDPIALNSLEINGTIDYNQISMNDLALKHNECMIFIANRFKSEGICPRDNEQTRLKLEEYLEEFLSANGLITDFDINSFQGLAEQDNLPFANPSLNLSTEANNLLNSLESTLTSFINGTTSQSEFESSTNLIINSSETLNSPSEKKIVELTATICKNSAIFWRDNLEIVEQIEFNACTNGSNQTSNKQINWGAVGAADASGAITWGVRGFVATLATGPGSIGTGIACGLQVLADIRRQDY
jgi:hypothetical protein